MLAIKLRRKVGSYSFPSLAWKGEDKFDNVFIQLSRWSIRKLPFFVLHFQKSFKQSNISFIFLSGIFVFVSQNKFLNLANRSKLSLDRFSRARGFLCNGFRVTFSSVRTFIYRE